MIGIPAVNHESQEIHVNVFCKRCVDFFLLSIIIIYLLYLFIQIMLDDTQIAYIDEFEDWNGMMDYLNNLTICINSNYANMRHLPKSRQIYNKTIAIEVNVDDLYTYDNFSGLTIEGRFNLDDWLPIYPKHTFKPNYLEVILTVPKSQVDKVCLVLTGPDEYLPQFAHNKNCSIALNRSEINQKLNIFGDLDDRNQMICHNSSIPKFTFPLIDTNSKGLHVLSRNFSGLRDSFLLFFLSKGLVLACFLVMVLLVELKRRKY